MDLRHARTFVAVAELGTVSKAALKLRIAQPALSRQIAALEQELGLKLFDRSRRRLLLTGEGEQLLGDCRILLEHANAIGERARILRHGEAGFLRVAASPQFIEGVLAKFCHRYSARYPNVELKLIEAIGWSDIREMLETGEIHLGQNLLHAVPHDDRRFATQPLHPVGLLAACQPEHPLSKNGAIDIAQLAPYPLLLLNGDFVFRKTFDAACRLARIDVDVKFESRTPHTLLAMAENGHGVAVVPSVLKMDSYALRVAAIKFRGTPLREPLAVFWDKRRALPRYAVGFCGMLAAYAREVMGGTQPLKRTQRRPGRKALSRPEASKGVTS